MLNKKIKNIFVKNLPLVLLIPLSLKILVSVFISYYTYDVAKVISYLVDSNSLSDYINSLRFGIAICVQMYGLSQVVDLNVQIIKFGSYIFFMGTFLVTINTFIGRKKTLLIKSFFLVLSCSVFFFSDTLTFLGSYGMLVYCQGFFMGAILLYLALDEFNFFLRSKPSRYWIYYFFFITLACFIDIRFSLYLCITFLGLLFVNIGKVKRQLRYLFFGVPSGVICLFFVYYQFISLPHLKNFRPAHVEKYLYNEGANFYKIVVFIFERMGDLAGTLVGDIIFIKLSFVILCVLGAINIWHKGQKLPVLILTLSLLTLIFTSLINAYPFGSIRYCTTLLSFFIYFFLEGLHVCHNKINLTSRKIYFTMPIALIAVIFIFSDAYEIYKERIEKFNKEKKIEESLMSASKTSKIYCDIVAEKIVKAYGVKCIVLTTWNTTKDLGEEEGFYNKVVSGMRRDNTLYLYLWKPISNVHFKELEELMNREGLRRQGSIKGHHFFYKYTR